MYKKTWLLLLLVSVISIGLIGCTSTAPAPGGQGEKENPFPEKAIQFICPTGAGGSTDLTVRPLVEAVGKVLGQPVAVENREGGASAVGLSAIAKSKADGYTLGVMVSSAGATAPHLREVPYNPIGDFDFICRYGVYVYTLSVPADSPFTSVDELVAFAKENPGKLKYGVSTPGSSPMLAVEQLGKHEDVQWEAVPFGDGAKSVAGLLGGHVNFGAFAGEDMPHVESGNLRVLAILSSEASPDLPEIKTLRELGYPVDAPAFLTIVAPKGLPKEVRNKLQDAFEEAMNDETFLKAMSSMMIAPAFMEGDATYEFVKSEYEKYATVLKEIGMIE